MSVLPGLDKVGREKDWELCRFKLGSLEGGGGLHPFQMFSPYLPSALTDFDPAASPYMRLSTFSSPGGGAPASGRRGVGNNNNNNNPRELLEGYISKFAERAGPALAAARSAAGPALAALKSRAAKIWSTGEMSGGELSYDAEGPGAKAAPPPEAGETTGGGASSPAVPLVTPPPFLSEKRKEQLNAAKEKAMNAAGMAASLFKSALAPPPPTTTTTTTTTTPSFTLPSTSGMKMPSWSAIQGAAAAARSAAVSAASAGARQLQAAIDKSQQQPQQQGSRGAAPPTGDEKTPRARNGSDAGDALLAHTLAGLGEGSELGLFDVQWKGRLTVFAGSALEGVGGANTFTAPLGGGGVGGDCTPSRDTFTSHPTPSSSAAAAAAVPAGGEDTVPPSLSSPPPLIPTYLALSRDRLILLSPHASGRLGVGVVRGNFHLTELGKCSFSKKVPGRVSVFLRRTTTSTRGAELSEEGGSPQGHLGGVERGDTPITTLVPLVFNLDGGAEAVKEFVTTLQAAVAGVRQ